MKKYRIREYSPMYWILGTIGVIIAVLFFSLPSTIEALL
nr:MAG TPA: Protein of unknown function (DUF2951) [Caudoviricetes sp.]